MIIIIVILKHPPTFKWLLLNNTFNRSAFGVRLYNPQSGETIRD